MLLTTIHLPYGRLCSCIIVNTLSNLTRELICSLFYYGEIGYWSSTFLVNTWVDISPGEFNPKVCPLSIICYLFQGISLKILSYCERCSHQWIIQGLGLNYSVDALDPSFFFSLSFGCTLWFLKLDSLLLHEWVFFRQSYFLLPGKTRTIWT